MVETTAAATAIGRGETGKASGQPRDVANHNPYIFDDGIDSSEDMGR